MVSWCTLGAPACLVEMGTSEGLALIGNTWPKTCLFSVGITPQVPPPRSPIPSTQGGSTSAPPHSWVHPSITHNPHPRIYLSQTLQSPPPAPPQTFGFPSSKLAPHYCRAPSPEQGTPPAAPSPLPLDAATSPLRYCQRVASASVCEINSEVERENYVKCGYSGAAGEARLMAKCLFVCLICIFFQRCIFRRVICCLFRPRSVSFLRQ